MTFACENCSTPLDPAQADEDDLIQCPACQAEHLVWHGDDGSIKIIPVHDDEDDLDEGDEDEDEGDEGDEDEGDEDEGDEDEGDEDEGDEDEDDLDLETEDDSDEE